MTSESRSIDSFDERFGDITVVDCGLVCSEIEVVSEIEQESSRSSRNSDAACPDCELARLWTCPVPLCSVVDLRACPVFLFACLLGQLLVRIVNLLGCGLALCPISVVVLCACPVVFFACLLGQLLARLFSLYSVMLARLRVLVAGRKFLQWDQAEESLC
ncbi:hypothetical protein Drorol1_Dr00004742, partial [Drosera rotundifolia]